LDQRTFCVETVVFLIPDPQLCASSLLTSVNLLSLSFHPLGLVVNGPTLSLLPDILLITPFPSPLSMSDPASTKVVTPLFFPMSLLNPNSSAPPLLRLRIYPGFPEGDQGLEAPREEVPPSNLDRERKVRKRGRRVAIEEAAMPIPVSMVDQIATSVVA
jgi:hypothetical protein